MGDMSRGLAGLYANFIYLFTFLVFFLFVPLWTKQKLNNGKGIAINNVEKSGFSFANIDFSYHLIPPPRQTKPVPTHIIQRQLSAKKPKENNEWKFIAVSPTISFELFIFIAP